MRSQHQQHTGSEYPEGRVDGPGLLYGAIGLALAVAMQVVGLFKKGDARIKNSLLDSVFHGVVPDQLSLAVLVIVTAIFCFGLAFAVLDSPGTWRRMILGVTALTVVIAMVPTLAVWNIYFSPFLPAIGIFWTWFCTMMYVNHHVMPCESLNTPDARSGVYDKFQTPPTQGAGATTNTHVVAAPQPVGKKVEIEAMEEANKPTKKKSAKKKAGKIKDPDAKYKPKEN